MIKLLVLELLSQRPMSGYEMKKIMEKTEAKRWSGVLPGSIYNAIKKLTHDGYIAVLSVEMTGNRQRSEYQITEKGRAYQLTLVQDALSSPIKFNGDFYAGVGFAYQLDSSLAIATLEANWSKLNKEKDKILQGKKEKEEAIAGELPVLSSMVLEHMLKSIELQKNLIEGIIETIKMENISD